MNTLKVLELEVQLNPVNHDLKILGDRRWLLLGGSTFQLYQHCFILLSLLVFIGQRRLRNLGFVLAEALL